MGENYNDFWLETNCMIGILTGKGAAVDEAKGWEIKPVWRKEMYVAKF